MRPHQLAAHILSDPLMQLEKGRGPWPPMCGRCRSRTCWVGRRSLDDSRVRSFVQGKTVMVTGGAGSIGAGALPSNRRLSAPDAWWWWISRRTLSTICRTICSTAMETG